MLVFSRDLGILLIATLLFATNTLRDFRPSLFGKLNTLVQIVASSWSSADLAFAFPQTTFLGDWLSAPSPSSRRYSAAQYAWIVIRRISTASTGATGRADRRLTRSAMSTGKPLIVHRSVFPLLGLFMRHVVVLGGIKYLATHLALDELDVVLAGDDLRTWDVCKGLS